jgi:branched-chain amino acid transport system permease protein
MDILLQQIMNGLVLGSIYALIALGYTMVYGILGIINFAHGEVLMIGAMVSLTLITLITQLPLGLPPWVLLVLVLLMTMGVCALVSYLIERFAYRSLRQAPRLAPLISAIGVSVLLQTLAMIIWSRNPMTYPQLLPSTPIDVFGSGATITGKEIVIIVTSFSVMALLLLIVQKTKLGRAMRATAEQPNVAALMGVNPNRVISITLMYISRWDLFQG